MNAKYNYILFFNDSTVLMPPDDGVFVYNYLVKSDTLSICNNKELKYNQWRKFQILVLTEDALILKNISKKDFGLKDDTITFVNTSTLNKCDAKIKGLEFHSYGVYRVDFKISKDTLIYTNDKKSNEVVADLRYKLSPSILNQLNAKIKLIEPNFAYIYNRSVYGRSYFYIKIELEEKYGGKNTIILDGGMPNPEENLRLASLIAYLINLDKIVTQNECSE